MSAGVIPFTHTAASAADDLVVGKNGIAEADTNFKVSCGAFSIEGSGPFVSFNSPVDTLFTDSTTGNPNEIGVRVKYPQFVSPGEEFTYDLDFDSIELNPKTFDDPENAVVAGELGYATRTKLDVDIPKGTDFVSASVNDPSSSGKFPTDIIRIKDDGNESATGTHLRMALNNATEQRTENGGVTKDGPNTSAHNDGGWSTTNRTMAIPGISVTVKAPDDTGGTSTSSVIGEITPTVRVGTNANVYNNPDNFFTFLTKNDVSDLIQPHSGYHSIRCSPRDTPDSDINSGGQPLTTIRVVRAQDSTDVPPDCTGKTGADLNQCILNDQVLQP
ncbi:hypothetical protein [Rhodococcus sp. WMMA185]|uniref:hypothetical protein n=1 Tax=Rhodococcus sp. WMMA185 TaxID=679318 RepID=UPI0012F50132|nr:hypothetical protein [Rhodococcus sp. WMMA185]